MHRVIALIFYFLSVSSTFDFNLTVDYKLIRGMFDCDKDCYFEKPEITSKTISKWPSKCESVCAVITLNQNCDVPSDKLKEAFKNMKYLDGGIRIENTSLTSLSFLPKIVTYCTLGISITNNSQLEIVDSIAEISQPGQEKCFLQMSGNKKLDARGFCESDNYKDVLGLQIFGNMVDCGCEGTLLNSQNLDHFQNCNHIMGKLTITNLTDNIPLLSNLTKLSGDLEIHHTRLENLSFLENLEHVVSKAVYYDFRIVIDIHDNLEMTRFGLKALRNLTSIGYGTLTMNFQNLHPNFCLTIEEIVQLILSEVQFINLEVQLCGHYTWSIEKPKLCVFDKMSNLAGDCIYIFGNLLVDSGDERYVEKLKNVTHVFGSVTVQNTDLEDAMFLEKLETVVKLNESIPVMQFLFNEWMQNLEFHNLKKFVTRGINKVIVNGNHPRFFEKVRECLLLQWRAQTNVSYNGGRCKDISTSLPNREGYDFDFDVYSEGAPMSWYATYDGLFWDDDLNEKIMKFTGNDLKMSNDIAAGIGFIINIFHLIVLFQKELRTNFIYILMIGIGFCDVLFVSTFLLDYGLDQIYNPNVCNSHRSPIWMYIRRVEQPIQESTRKSSSILAFLMVLFRTCSVMFPTSGTLITVSKPILAVIVIFGLTSGMFILDSKNYWSCRAKSNSNWVPSTQSEVICVYIDCPDVSDYNAYGGSALQKSIDGYFTITLAGLYLIVTLILLVQLQIAKNRRKNLKRESSDNTSLLVACMAFTFFISESFYGLLFVWDSYLIKHYSILRAILVSGRGLLWTLLTANSSVHCLTCFLMSSQYRGVARRMFWFKKKETISSIDSKSVTKTSYGTSGSK